MKLTIKRKWFDKIKKRDKRFELRDAHITFIADDNGETITFPVLRVEIYSKEISKRILNYITEKEFRSMFDDKKQICFYLGDKDKGVTHGKA